MEGLTDPQIQEKRGSPPWVIANELLEGSSLPYRLTTPEGLKILDPYQCEIIAQDTGAKLAPKQLSSGERVLFGLIMALFTSNSYKLLPRLLLLDEPDAHLHTSQISGFLRVIRETLVDQYECRVIIATHRPDTIVQLKPSEIFEVHRRATPRITPAQGHPLVLSRLTSHLIDILPGTRCVFVEDEADALFYNDVRDALLSEKMIEPVPSLVFVPASLGKGQNKVSGGVNVVRASVEKLRSAGLPMVLGIEDEDNKPNKAATDGIFAIKRYSIENYQYDPLLVFAVLVDARNPPVVPALPRFSPGDEVKLAKMPGTELQKIVDAIAKEFAACIPGINSAPSGVYPATLVHGQTLQIPNWLRTMQGHEIRVEAINRVSRLLDPKKLSHMLVRTRLVYQELRDLMLNIQKS